jgi:hypothetical protein
MFTIILFPVKPENKDYPYYKSPKKVLEIEDDEAIKYATGAKGVYYLRHHIDDMDGLTDREIVDYYNSMSKPKIQILSKKTGKGYSTENKDYYVRIVRYAHT